jgi:hypothetical protein
LDVKAAARNNIQVIMPVQHHGEAAALVQHGKSGAHAILDATLVQKHENASVIAQHGMFAAHAMLDVTRAHRLKNAAPAPPRARLGR